MIRRGIGVQSYVSAGGGTDADAQAVITAIESTGVTLTATQKTACNTLVTDLKGYGIWTKLKAVYGFLGGTAAAHKWNWKNPADTDAAFRLVFSGGWTHSSTGALPNGTNAYADTFLTQIASGAFNNVHLSYYSRTNNLTANFQLEMGMGVAGTDFKYISLGTRFNTDFPLCGGNAGSRGANGASNSSACFGMISATSSTLCKSYRNGNLIATNTAAQTSTPENFKIYIGSQGASGTPTSYSSRQCAFASIGDGLTDTEAANLYTAVQAYQTTLNRNI